MKTISITSIILLILIGFSCKKLSKTSSGNHKVHNLDLSRDKTPFTGELKNHFYWNDEGGKHLVIISGRKLLNKGEYGREEIFAYQFVKQSKEWNLEWEFYDFVDSQGCDLEIRIPANYIRIQDVDHDGHSETLFLYTLDNRCDAVMVNTKLVLYTKGKQFIISGLSSQFLGPPEHVFNSYRKEEGLKPISYKDMDKRFIHENEKLKHFASNTWDDFIKMDNKKK